MNKRQRRTLSKFKETTYMQFSQQKRNRDPKKNIQSNKKKTPTATGQANKNIRKT